MVQARNPCRPVQQIVEYMGLQSLSSWQRCQKDTGNKSIFNRWCWANWTSTHITIKLGPIYHLIQKKFQMDQRPKHETWNCWENTGSARNDSGVESSFWPGLRLHDSGVEIPSCPQIKAQTWQVRLDKTEKLSWCREGSHPVLLSRDAHYVLQQPLPGQVIPKGQYSLEPVWNSL